MASVRGSLLAGADRPERSGDPPSFSLVAELCLFRDKPMAMMLHQAAASELPSSIFASVNASR